MPSSKDEFLRPGVFHLLNCDNVPINQRIKLCKYIWKNADNLPRKEQSVVNWLTSTIVNGSTNDFLVVWKTVAEVLNSALVFKFLQNPSHTIAVKPSFIKVLLTEIETISTAGPLLSTLIAVTKTLLNNSKIVSDVHKYLIVLKLASVWFIASIRLSNSEDSSTMFLITDLLLKDILLKVKEKFNNQSNSKKSLSLFLDHLFLPMVKLIAMLKSSHDCLTRDKLALLEDCALHTIFARKNADVFEKYFNKLEVTQQIETKEKDKPDRVVDQFWRKLDELFHEDSHLVGPVTVHIVDMFTASYAKCGHNLHFQFYSQMEKYLTGAEKNFKALGELLQLYGIRCGNHSNTQGPSKEEEDHFAALLNMLLGCDIRNFEAWASCVSALFEIDHCLVSSKLELIFVKLLRLPTSLLSENSLKIFFHDLAQHFNKTRKQSDLMSSYLRALKESDLTAHQHLTTSNFAATFSNECILQCPYNTAMDLLQDIQKSISNSISEASSNDDNSTEQFRTKAEGKTGKKRKLSVEIGAAPGKKQKLSNSIVSHLVILLKSVLEECDFLSMRQQVFVLKPLEEFLSIQQELIQKFFAICNKQPDESLIKSCIEFLGIHHDLVSSLERYSVGKDVFVESGLIAENAKNLKTLVARHVPSSKEVSISFAKWRCSTLRWNIWQSHAGKETDHKLLEEIASEVLLHSSNALSVKNSLKESDADLFSFIEEMFYLFVDLPEVHEKLIDLLFEHMTCHQSKLDFTKKLLQSSTLAQRPSFNDLIIARVLQGFVDFELGNKKYLKLIRSVQKSFNKPSSETSSFLKIANAFSEGSPKKQKQDKADQLNSALWYLEILEILAPSCANRVVTILGIALSSLYLSTNLEESDFRAELDSKIVSLLHTVLVLDPKLGGNLPVRFMFCFLSSHLHKFAERENCKLLQLVTFLTNSCCHEKSSASVLEAEVLKYLSLGQQNNSMIIEVIFTAVSTKILKRLKVIPSALTDSLFLLFTNPSHLPRPHFIKVQTPMFSELDRKSLLTGNLEALQLQISMLKHFVEEFENLGLQHQEASSLELEAPYLLAHFTLAQCDDTQAGNIRNVFLSSSHAKASLNRMDPFSRLKLELLRTEIAFYYKKCRQITLTKSGSWSDDVKSCLSFYTDSSLKASPLANAVMNRITIANLQMAPSLEAVKGFLSEGVSEIFRGNDQLAVEAQLSFVKILSSTYDFRTKSFLSFRTQLTVESFAEQSQQLYVDYLRESFEATSAMVGAETSKELTTAAMSSLAAILNLGKPVIKSRQISLAFNVMVRVRFASFAAVDSQVAVFSDMYELLDSVLVHHSEAAIGLVPLILSVCQKLLNFCMETGRQTNIKLNGSLLESSLRCSRLLDRLFHYISSNYGSYFKRSVAFLVADFVFGLSRDTLHPSVKKLLQNALYHLVALCDEYSIAMLRTTLPAGVRDVFRQFYNEFTKFYKYTGKV